MVMLMMVAVGRGKHGNCFGDVGDVLSYENVCDDDCN